MNNLRLPVAGRQVWTAFGTLCFILLVLGGWWIFRLRFVEHLLQQTQAGVKEGSGTAARFISEMRIAGDILLGTTVLTTIGMGLSMAKFVRQFKADNEVLQVKIVERKEAEEELRGKTAFLEAQVNASIDGILVVNELGKKALQNQKMADLFKIPQQIAEDKDDEKQLRWVTGLVKNSRQFAEKVLHLNAHRSEISRDEIELKDGSFLDRYSSPVTGSDGKYYGRIWVFRDITERKRTEESLRLLSSAVQQSRESIMITDAALEFPGPKIVFVNPAFSQMTGYTAEEVLEKTPRILQGPHTDRVVLARLRQNLKQGEVFAGEAINYRRDGREFNLEWQIAPIRDGCGKVTHFVAIQHDITARKQAEGRFRRLMDSNVQGVLFWNRKGEIVEANDAFLDLVHYTRADLAAGRLDWVAMTPPEFAERDRRALEEIAVSGTCLSYEKEFIRKDGARVPVLLGSANFTDNTDEGVCFVLDLTTRKRLEAQLFQSQKMETVGKLAGGIAHEFNSILTAIIGQSELLLQDLSPENSLSHHAVEIRKAAERAASLTRQLLAYGRKQILSPSILDLNAIVAGMESTLRHLMGRGVDLQLVLALELKAVKADAGQIEQVIMNVAMNADDAMCNAGRLTLETSNVSLDQEYVRRFPELKAGEYVMLAITDTGTGMSEEIKARIFEPFFTTKEIGQGTGLGLSTCYGIIKQSGGHLSVYSEPARGATFKIYLPSVELPTQAFPRRIEPSDLAAGTETILLVEDDPALREMAATLLRRLGYNVLAAANGVEALGLKQKRNIGHIDLLFTDVVMPHMSGKELSERVRILYPHTRILFTSAYTGGAIIHQGVLDAGVHLLQKPFTPSALARKIREVLDQPITPPVESA